MKKLFLIGIVLVLTGATFWYFNKGENVQANPYRYVSVEQGDLEAVVASTGTLDAVTTVQVGTQVSGIISHIYVDFNDRVRRGQIIARIDTTLLVSAVKEAQTTLQRNKAQLRQAEREYERIKKLFDRQFVTEVEFNKVTYDLDIAKAAIQSAEISLDRAERNLGYATIYAPIDGVVIERNVDAGQTVAASLSAPQLFLIANDLAQMEILASVDESDIGFIKEGQSARFTVQAYPDDSFEGIVRQVRLQSNMQENVVNYTVVIDVSNEEGTLLPGMTATVEFLIETATDVMKISNAALRFQPPEDMLNAFRERMMAQRQANRSDSTSAGRRGPGGEGRGGERGNFGQGGNGAGQSADRGGFGPGGNGAGLRGTPGEGGMGGFGQGAGRRNITMLWYLDDEGQLAMSPVRTGITDGQMTEIRGRNIEAGMQIIAGVTQVAQAQSSNPFQSQQSNRGRRPGSF